MTNILSKCIEELKKEEPRIDYVLGMLESVVEMQGTPMVSLAKSVPTQQVMTPGAVQPMPEDQESAMLEAQARAAVSEIARIAQASSHEG